MSAATLLPGARAPRFGPDDGFHAALRRAVRGHFEATGQAPHGDRRLHLKTAVLLAWFLASYLLLLLGARAAWQALPLAVSLGLAMAGIGFCVQHDGGHGSYSRSRRVNRLMAFALDLLGGSSYVWRVKHNLLHHTYPNRVGLDDDVDVGRLARFLPEQPRLLFHRLQHLYLWPLYGALAVKWHWFDDFHHLLTGRLGGARMARPRGVELALFVLGKLAFFGWALAVPLALHPARAVLLAYAVTAFSLGLTLAVVFQLAHLVPEASAPPRRPLGWARLQAESAADFAPRSALLGWYVGGLNFQIEHHLFPGISHVHYAALAPIVRATCREFGVPYACHPSLGAAVAAHWRWLREMGRAASAPSAGTGP